MDERKRRLWSRAAASASLSLLVALPLIAAAAPLSGSGIFDEDRLFTQHILNQFIERFCERQGALGDRLIVSLIDPEKCAPPLPPPTLTLVKEVMNDDGGTATAADFQAMIDGEDVDWGVAREVSVGAHAASETMLEGYEASAWGSDCAADGMVTLAPGEDKTCTITNDDIAPPPTTGSIMIVKMVVNDDEGMATSSAWTLHLHTGDLMVDVDGSPQPGSDTGTVYADLAPGTYHVAETGPDGYTATFSGDCGSDGFITIAAGENKTCTVTNDDPVVVVGKLLITEVHYDLASGDLQGTESGNEWVEIHNGTNVVMDLSGFTIHDEGVSSDALPEGTILTPGQFLVVTSSETTASFYSIPAETVVVVLESNIGSNGLTNNGDMVELRSPFDISIDAVSWGDNVTAFDPAVPLVAANAGHSIARTPITTDTDSAADWAENETPSPGS